MSRREVVGIAKLLVSYKVLAFDTTFSTELARMLQDPGAIISSLLPRVESWQLQGPQKITRKGMMHLSSAESVGICCQWCVACSGHPWNLSGRQRESLHAPSCGADSTTSVTAFPQNWWRSWRKPPFWPSSHTFSGPGISRTNLM